MDKKKRKKKLKTFNLDEEIYAEFLEYCKKEGFSMSRKVESFMKLELDRLKVGKKIFEVNKRDEKEHSFKRYC